MHFQFTAEQETFRSSIRDVLEGEGIAPAVCAPDTVARLWRQAAGQGWLGMMLPEARGGLGLALCDALVLQEEIGRALAPGPFATNVALFPAFLAASGGATPLADLASGIVSGEQVLSLGEEVLSLGEEVTAPGKGPSSEPPAHSKSPAVVVEYPAMASHVVALSRRHDEMAICSVGDAVMRDRKPFDLTQPLGELALDVATGPALAKLVERATIGRVRDAMRIAAAAETVGLCEKVLEDTVEHARGRRQFGQPIGAFQAVKHRLADAFVGLENARTSVYYAAWAWDQQLPDAALAADMAAAYAGEMGPRLVCDCVQVHGGFGFAWESGLHFYLRRANRLAMTLGTPREARRAIADRILAMDQASVTAAPAGAGELEDAAADAP